MKKYSKIVLGRFVYIPKNEIADIDKAKEKMTAISVYNKDKRIPIYDDSMSGWLGIPLYYIKEIEKYAEKIIDKRIEGEKINIKFKSSFWEGQKEVVTNFSKNLRHGKTGFILESRPGTGKTVCVIAMMAVLNRKAIIVVPRSNLVKQWIERLEEHSNLTRDDIGYVNGSNVAWQGRKVVVGLVHTLALNRLPEEFKKEFGVAIYDEVHASTPPETFSPVASMFPAKVRIGMSATLKRKDSLDQVFRSHICQVFIKGHIENRMEAKVIIHEFDGNSGPIFGKTKINRRGMLISRLAKNPKRNLLIVKYILMMLKSHRRVLVMSDRTEQLINIRDLLFSGVYPAELKKEKVGFYVRRLPVSAKSGKKYYKELKPEYRRQVASACKVILGTYGMFALGTDVKTLSGLIYATPQSDIRQTQGRIERIAEDKKQPIVVDIVDTAYKETIGWGYARERFYNASGIEITKVK